jgi:hypothetical protein
MSDDFGCNCCDGPFIDELLQQKRPKPTPQRKLWTPREFNDYLRCTMPERDQVRKAGIPTKKEFNSWEPSRRNFLKTMVVGAGGVLAWYSGLLQSPKARAQCLADWDVTCLLGTGYFMNCDEWGARPPSLPILMHPWPPSHFVVHHTATANSTDYSQGHAIALAKSIQNYHMDYNGWKDTGQHFTNTRGAWITEGRHRSIEWELLANYDAHCRGTHVAYNNRYCTGCENEGTYVTEDPPPAQFANLINIAATCCLYNGPMYSYNCHGHRDYNATQCPGDRLYALIPCLRQWVAYYVEGGGYPNC